MTAHRWLGVSLAWMVAAAAFASCKGSTVTASSAGGGGGGSATATGGSDGGDGAVPDAADGGGEAGPIVCLATYTNVTKGPCDLIDQDCPPGWTCEPTSGTKPTTSCQLTFGLKTENEDCYNPTECDAKLICVGGNAGHPGKCLAFCCPDKANEPCNGGICNEKVEFGGGIYAYVCSYGMRCQLLMANACPSGYDCHVENAAGQGVAVCFEPSPTLVPEFGICNYINDCGNMQDCYGLSGTSAGVCLYYCALSGPNTDASPGLGGCPMGESCQSSYQGQPINTGVTGVGLCIPDDGIIPKDMDAGSDGDAATGDAGDAGPKDAGPKDAGGDASDGGDDAGDGGIEDASADG